MNLLKFWFLNLGFLISFFKFYLFLKIPFIYLFLDRGEGKEKERERNIDVQEIHQSLGCLLHTCNWGTWPTTLASALTGNQTGDLWVHRLALSSLSHTSQGRFLISYGVFFFLLRFYVFLEREGGREKEGEKHQCETEPSISCLSNTPWLGTKPATQVCALTRDRTGDLLLCRMMPN